jgi:L,D-transpeptidase YcbB
MKLIYGMVIGLTLAVGPITPLPVFAQNRALTETAQPVDATLAAAISKYARGEVGAFYASRGFRPLWSEKGLIGPQAQALLRILDDAALDGLKPSRYKPDRLRMAIARADAGGVDDLARAEIALSDAFARYVRDARRVKKPAMEFADPALIPERPDTGRVLRVAGLAESFRDYLASMGFMRAPANCSALALPGGSTATPSAPSASIWSAPAFCRRPPCGISSSMPHRRGSGIIRQASRPGR